MATSAVVGVSDGVGFAPPSWSLDIVAAVVAVVVAAAVVVVAVAVVVVVVDVVAVFASAVVVESGPRHGTVVDDVAVRNLRSVVVVLVVVIVGVMLLVSGGLGAGLCCFDATSLGSRRRSAADTSRGRPRVAK